MAQENERAKQMRLPDIYKCMQCGFTYAYQTISSGRRIQKDCAKCGGIYFDWINAEEMLRRDR